ncbi:hypothetical protein SORBI_3008G095633 [Sorghum bicolor]|uniref:Uncharacterized protein n=1 Tax=Sorghum bicolor TaxID=4558 RepID=A0A1Z5R696_SORBI|nr:hypothetical protein SORBI_3008G095633 [Sorghum bicolor]
MFCVSLIFSLFLHIAEPPLTDYELFRMKKCLRNNTYMHSLGLPVLAQLCKNTFVPQEKQQQKDKEDSGSEYNGEDEANNDAHLSDDDLEPSTVSSKKKATTNKRKRGADKEQPRMQSSIVTRGMKKRPDDVSAMNIQADIPNQAAEEADAGEQNEQERNELNLDATPNGETVNDVNENGETHASNVAEDELLDEEDRTRGPSIGRELVQMTRSRKKKLPLVIEPGKRRPKSVMIAAKFATKCNIAVRQIVPIFPHWKEYKKYPKMIDAYISRVVTKFHTDTNSVPVKKACLAMMKEAVRQQRYKLKKRYFDAFPLHQVPKTSPVGTMTDVQWDHLVEHWKKEEKMVTCEKNRENRSKVQFHQTTGSRSYEMHIVNLAEKYKNEPPNALELFKETHYSKKKGFSPAVQSLVVEIEDNLNQPVDEALEPKDVTEVLSEALVQKTKKNRFLVNVGLKSSATRGSAEYDLQEELVVEKQTSSDLREIVKTQQQQMDEMMKKLEEKEAAMAKREEESKKREANIDALIKTFMSMVPGDQATQ